ncbi:MAG: right-handed parallel beta-helix repeat-containing protein, partial [Candidatus Freyarchaeota archaeon]
MGGVKTRKEALRILVLTAILLGATIPAVITNGNQNMYVLINAHIQDASQLAPAVIREKTLNISSDYTFTENVYETINVMADNIVIDGNGYILQGPGTGYGFYLDGRTNVTIKNVLVKGWEYGFYLDHSSNNNLVGNTASNNDENGFRLHYCCDNNNLVG